MRQFLRFFASSAIVLAAFAAQADELESMLQRIDRIQADPAARQAAVEAGEERTLLCQYCHGADGNSAKAEVPNLAGQNVGYLLQQIDHFSSGTRKDYVMNQLAENFSAEDKINVALFYHHQSLRAQLVDSALAVRGRPLYQHLCRECHGEDGHGSVTLARLASQRPDYVAYSLHQFRDEAAGKGGLQRRNPLMADVAKKLTDEQIEALAAYVAQMP